MCFEHHACHITHLFVKMESLVHPECHLKDFHQCRLVIEADGLTSPTEIGDQWASMEEYSDGRAQLAL